MAIRFYDGIKEINAAERPIQKAWQLAVFHLEIDKINKNIEKIIEILGDHENLLINSNPYHNHYHLAEVIWGSAFLAKQEEIKEKYFESMIILLLAATFHDAEHLGRANRNPFELEKRAANFFRDWWKNNSLFVENIIDLQTTIVENLVIELILCTDFNEGQPQVTREYSVKKDIETNGLKLFRLKKILNEADILMSCLPHFGFIKTSLILKESLRNPPDEHKWLLLLGFIKDVQAFFISDAAKKLRIDLIIEDFINFLHANRSLMKDGLKLQEKIEEIFQQF